MCLIYEHILAYRRDVIQTKRNWNISIYVSHMSLMRAIYKYIARNIARLYLKQTESRRHRRFLRQNDQTNQKRGAGQ